MHKQNFWHKLGGMLLIPHELLHVLAFRLIGKPCAYRLGAWTVQPLSARTYFLEHGPTWHLAFFGLSFAAFAYGSTALADLIKAYWLIFRFEECKHILLGPN